MLIIVTPLIFITSLDNSFDLAKKTSLILFGGLYIITTGLYFFNKTYGDKSATEFFIDKKIDPLIFLFLAGGLISTALSINKYVSFNGLYLRQIGFDTYFYLFVIYFITSQFLYFAENKKFTIDNVLKIIEFTAAVVALYGILQYLKFDPFNAPLVGGVRPVSTMGHSTFAGGFFVLLLPFAFVRIFREEKPIIGAVLTIVIACGIIVVQSRAAYAGAILVTVISLLLLPFIYKNDPSKYKKVWKINAGILIGGISALVLAVLLLPDNPFTTKLMMISELPRSARWILWRDTFEAYKVHPFFGSGIGTFGSVFQFFTSYELKALEPKNIFDHPHNVFLNTLVTMGAVGAALYILLLLQGMYCSVKAFLNNAIDSRSRLFFLAAFAGLAGYSVYSIAAFENIPILLYLFILMAMLKVMYSKFYGKINLSEKVNYALVYAGTVLAAGLILFSIWSFYPAHNRFMADLHYKLSKELYAKGDFKNSVVELNKAVIIDSDNPDYKFTLAANVQDFCLRNPLNNEAKISLLQQAEQELERAKPKFYLFMHYKALHAMLKLQLGDTAAFEETKNFIYKHDTLLVYFRLNMARYNFINGNAPEMLNDINSIVSIDPYNSDAVMLLASYYASVKEKTKALEVCDKYLQKYSQDPLVLSLRTKIQNSP